MCNLKELFSDYIIKLYNLILDRTPSTDEIDYWIRILSNSSPRFVAAQIEKSHEALVILIDSWYVNYLGRNASIIELDFWINIFDTEENILSQILGSDEFYTYAQTIATGATADEKFITALYNLLLDRAPDPGGLIFWINNIGIGRTTIAFDFLKSFEYRRLIINQYYQDILNRQTNIDNFVQSQYDLLTIKIRIESGAEYLGRRLVIIFNDQAAIYLPSPEFGNANKISMNKINRRSRGGDALVYRDPMWPIDETFDMTWDSLDQDDCNNLLNFLQLTLGQLVTLIDYENREFNGIITNPAGQVTQTTISRFSAHLEFTAI